MLYEHRPASPTRAAATAAANGELTFRPKSATRQGGEETYWRKFKLPPGQDFEAFIERQERCAKVGASGTARCSVEGA